MSLLADQPTSKEPEREATRDQVRGVLISNQFLCELLRFPPGTKIVGYNAERAWREHQPDLELAVINPVFSPVLPGTEISLVSPIYEANHETGEVEFVSWS